MRIIDGTSSRALMILLCICIISMSFAAPLQAYAVAGIDDALYLLLGTLAVGGGIVVADQAGLDQLVMDMYNSMPDDLKASLRTVAGVVSGSTSIRDLVAKGAVGLGEWLGTWFGSHAVVDGAITVNPLGSTFVSDEIVLSGDVGAVHSVNGITISVLADSSLSVVFYDGTVLDTSKMSIHKGHPITIRFTYTSDYNAVLFWLVRWGAISTGVTETQLYPGCYDYISALLAGTTVPAFGATVGASTTYFPTVETPDALNEDTPLQIPALPGQLIGQTAPGIRDGAVNPPIDPPIEGDTTGSGSITGEGGGTGIFEGIGKWILSLPILGDILKAIQAIGSGIAGFFDVEQFELDLQPLKVGLTTVFPFCIPFDLLRFVQVFSASPTDFQFRIFLETDYWTIDHTVDLSLLRVPILFFRYVVVLWFIYILISRTRDMIKW